MNLSHLGDIEHYQKRLDFYLKLKEKLGTQTGVPEKWIQIYQNRIRSIEKNNSKLGLKVSLSSSIRGIEAEKQA